MTISSSTKTIINGKWQFPDILEFEDAYGFVYLIKNKLDDRCYIGKKAFKGAGKTTKGKPTNWRTYCGSSKTLLEDMSALGQDKFEFHVLEQYYTKGAVSWAETWSHCFVEVPSNHNKFYNRLIEKVIWKVTEPVTQRHKDRLQQLCYS